MRFSSQLPAVNDPETLAAYARLAGLAIGNAGGRNLVRGMPAKTLEAGLSERMVVIEFDSVDAALAAYESAAYKEARNLLGNTVDRDHPYRRGGGVEALLGRVPLGYLPERRVKPPLHPMPRLNPVAKSRCALQSQHQSGSSWSPSGKCWVRVAAKTRPRPRTQSRALSEVDTCACQS